MPPWHSVPELSDGTSSARERQHDRGSPSSTQRSQENLRALANRYGMNQKTVAKWRKRAGVADLLTGPKEPKSTVLTVEEEAIIGAFRKHTLLPLDH